MRLGKQVEDVEERRPSKLGETERLETASLNLGASPDRTLQSQAE
jgi:hypothetical protein